ncbi:hypothetical protein N7520_001446 [Penicillium odoratum]|uniref:uncharacterized protein n=1 Tax=Penicillium odoratum TaxID=1167516 RepID=UPI002546618B|nr:uncharacterized protein N7520_001446 [Penicillium odoratum]KAJ5778200.1 hypothetical protein N7520_001446 [Penicillium odoratum]
MSSRADHPPERDSGSPANDQQYGMSEDRRSPYQRSYGSFGRRAIPPSDGRTSGELEGTTLGSSSRDGDRRTLNPRRTQSSGGFLLDSLPRSNSTRISSQHPRPSVLPPERRNTPDPGIVVPKKRSRFRWNRHKNSASESAAAATTTPTVTLQTSTPPPDDQRSQSSSTAEPPVHDTQQNTRGLDRDSLQIVNLALNLNESRRRNISGMPVGSNGRRPLSVSQPITGPVDLQGPSSIGNRASYDLSHRNYTQFPNELSRAPQSGGQSPVVEFLPAAVVNDTRAYEFSDSTLARAEKARRHFDLFHEYLRLLPLLPPLRNGPATDDVDSLSNSGQRSAAHRGYNPLQIIRNRRIRYREKCPINAEAEGWHDTGKVHDWISTIEEQYNHQTYDETQSIKLPSFKQSHWQTSQGDPEDMEILATSPPSSLRRVSRTNSVKAPRLRLDWKISPAELIADVAWVEDLSNKAKIVDKDGNKIYPDPAELALLDPEAELAAAQKEHLAVNQEHFADDGHSSRHTSMSSSHPARTAEFKSLNQGRQRHRFQTHAQGLRSRSASSSRKRSRWDKMKMRSGSVSSDSSRERRESVDRKNSTLEHSRKDLEKLLHGSLADSSESRISRKRSTATGAHTSKAMKGNYAARKASLSSAGSIEDRLNTRISLEGMDSSVPNSPAQASYFPSIAVNLSPPSSRSPSPAKKGLRHKIVARHERSKSKQGDRDIGENGAEDSQLDSVTSNPLSPPSEQAEIASGLEPSPLPDIVSSVYNDDGMNESHRVDSYRGRKGQYSGESKLRGILKGPGRIAEIVGNEVSKVGDLILKKDLPPDSRKSSSADTLASDSSDSDEEEKRLDKRKGLLRRHLADEPGRLIRRESEKGTPSRSFIPTLPSFTSPLRQDERSGQSEAVDFDSPQERGTASKRTGLSRSKTLDFGPALSASRGRKPHEIKDRSVPFSLTRPPVTGLAQVSPGSPTKKRLPLSSSTRAWSISGRSLQSLNDSGIPGRAEVERTRTLLLSSGIKAREIIRRAHSVRDPPPHWLQSSMGSTASIPRVTRIGEVDLAAQNFLRRFEMTQYSFQQSMHHFTTTTSSPLHSQLKDLEILIGQNLTPRVRATADEAENLCVQLNTTSTLAVKSLSDALDRGLRKRRRRLRWVRRAGFVALEWALVGMLWWVWLIVMGFKLVRGVFRGAISGARWILWL